MEMNKGNALTVSHDWRPNMIMRQTMKVASSMKCNLCMLV